MFEASGEILLIAAVALIVLGPSKFPEIFRMFGRTVGEFRRMTADVKATLEREIERAEEVKRIEETKNELFGEAPSADSQDVAFGPGHAVDAPAPADAPAPTEAAQPPVEADPAPSVQTAAVAEPAQVQSEAAPAPTREELIDQGFGTGHSFASGPPPGQPAATPRDDTPVTGQSQDKNHA